MKVPALILSALLIALPALHSEEGYTNVDLSPITNFKIDAVKKYPTGLVQLGGVPFKLPKSRQAVQTEGPHWAGRPILAGIATNIHLPTAIFILLSGRDVKAEFKGKQVGEIALTFTNEKSEEKTLSYPITAWATLRENWAYNNEIHQPVAEGNPKLVNVYAEPQTRAGKKATAFLDMFVIELKPDEVPGELTQIDIKDTSRETVGDSAPSLIVAGITVKHQ